MRKSLMVKLLGAFLLVIAINLVIITLLISFSTRNAFNLYTTRSSQVFAQRLAPTLADYYTQFNGWSGVEFFIQTEVAAQSPNNMMDNNPGMGMGNGRHSNTNNMGAGADQRYVLVDENDIVIVDSQGSLIGKQLSEKDLANGAVIVANGNPVGTLIMTPANFAGDNTPAGEFLSSVNRASINSAVIAGIIALILGAIFAMQIIKPIQLLDKAALAISSGHLNQRVPIHSQDEIGSLGSTFNQMAENLSKAETNRKHLVADIAHELRTPLASIQGTLEAMQDNILPLDSEQVSALHAETVLLTRLVGDLRLLSLAEAGELKLEYQETELQVLLHKIVERSKVQAQQKNINLSTEIQDNLPRIKIDADRITQVINNLIGNAIRYTPIGGSVQIQASRTPHAEFILVSVVDSGPGIHPDDLPYVFDRFYRADKSRTRSSGGSGLGLAIVKQLIEAHAGRVTATSPIIWDEQQHGYGTNISFYLPIQRS